MQEFARYTAYSGSYSYVYILLYQVLSQDIAGNYSTVKLQAIIQVNGANYISWSSGSASLHTDSFGLATTYYKGNTVVRELTINIAHDSDGTKTQYIGGSISTTYLMNGSCGGNIVLPNIPRASSLNTFTISDNDIEGIIKCSVTKKVSSYTDKLRISIPNVKVLQTFENYTSEQEVSLSTDVINDLFEYTKNSSTVTLEAVIETYNGSNKIADSNALTLIGYIKKAAPTFTYTSVETNNNIVSILGSSSDYVVQNASVLRFTVVPMSYKKATINNVNIVNNNKTYVDTTSPYSIDIPVVTSAFEVRVVDSRAYSTLTSFSKTLIPYLPISIKNYSFVRESQTSSNIILNATIQYKQTTFNSTANVPTIKWKLEESGTLHTIESSNYTIDTQNNEITITNLKLENILPYTSNGKLYLLVNDLITEDAENSIVLKGIPTFDAGEHDFNVNGDFTISDTDGENPIDVKQLLTSGFEHYSEEEVVIGTWTDGKTLYQKVIDVTMSASNESVYFPIETNITDMDICVQAFGCAYYEQNNIFLPLNFYNTGGFNSFYLDNHGQRIIMEHNGQYPTTTGYIILKYTKTTD